MACGKRIDKNIKILFLSSVNWHSLKQRPQFMAKYLDMIPGFSVRFMSIWNYRRGYIKNNDTLGIKPGTIPRLPFERFKVIEKISKLMGRAALRKHFRANDIVYVTNPSFFIYIKNTALPVIYDCCDDFIEFQDNNADNNKIFNSETGILQKAALVIFTSHYLQKTVKQRAGFEFKSIVINNAVNIPQNQLSRPPVIARLNENGKRNITYIGAVSHWFDYEIIKNIAKKNKRLMFNLVGPADIEVSPAENIRFWGAQKHEAIFPIMDAADALIMPFKLNKLILSVNPIKLYEYIYSGKPVISIRYGETEKFEDFVYLYEAGNENSLNAVFALLETNKYTPKKSLTECQQFAFQNTWEKRVEALVPYLNECTKEQ